jgi:N,N'-diacetyllegionaminate synthase
MNHTIIIAEAGVNHNGSIELAKLLIDEAVESGVDYIKFQTFKSENLVTRTAKQADYQKKNIGDSDNSQYNMLKELELSEEQHFELIEYCNKKGIKFFSTAFDMDSIDFLTSLNLGLWKIPSGELTSYPYVKKIASFGEPVILSTGMSSTEEISDTVNLLVSCGLPKEKITILHCNTEYPTPMCDVNLLAMNSIKKRFQTEIGYSDHTVGIEVPIAAVALGAKVIEKHFTLDRNLPGPDHKASLEPSELKAMVSAIRNIEQALGSEMVLRYSENIWQKRRKYPLQK